MSQVKYAVLSGPWDYLDGGYPLRLWNSLEACRQNNLFGPGAEFVLVQITPIRRGPPAVSAPQFFSAAGRPWTLDDEERMERRRDD